MKKGIYILVALTGLLLAGYAGLRGYKVWKESRMLALARQFMTQSNDRSAFLSLKQAIQSNPANPEGYRLLAELAEKVRNREAVLLRSRVVELAPDSVDDKLALARTALVFADLVTASSALQSVPIRGQNSAAYHNLAGTLAILNGQYPTAEAHWLEVAKFEPTNKIPSLKVAALRLAHTNEQVRANGRATLLDLTKDPDVNCLAFRELISDAARGGHTNDYENLVAQLVRQPNATFTDKLMQLDVLHKKQDPAFSFQLAALQKEALSNPAKIQPLATWQIHKMGPGDALGWMNTLPPDLQTNQPVAFLKADCRNNLKDWKGLQAELEPQEWGDLEFMRHAFIYRALRGQELASSAKTTWERAVNSAQTQKYRLSALLRLTVQWDMPAEQEKLLWMFVTQFPGEKWAPEALAKLLHGRGQTHGLLSLYAQLSKANPSDVDLKNNLAVTGLLVDAPQVNAHALAAEVYRASPTNVHCVSTYALSLYLQDKRAEALSLLEQLPAQDLEQAQLAGYYAMFLQATGNKEKAARYFEAGSSAMLLPEERKLLERAKQL